jgi:hypothetical protein
MRNNDASPTGKCGAVLLDVRVQTCKKMTAVPLKIMVLVRESVGDEVGKCSGVRCKMTVVSASPLPLVN